MVINGSDLAIFYQFLTQDRNSVKIVLGSDCSLELCINLTGLIFEKKVSFEVLDEVQNVKKSREKLVKCQDFRGFSKMFWQRLLTSNFLQEKKEPNDVFDYLNSNLVLKL